MSTDEPPVRPRRTRTAAAKSGTAAAGGAKKPTVAKLPRASSKAMRRKIRNVEVCNVEVSNVEVSKPKAGNVQVQRATSGLEAGSSETERQPSVGHQA